jgi:phospholipid/cholesterol/gamma-HCH transport system permease protein
MFNTFLNTVKDFFEALGEHLFIFINTLKAYRYVPKRRKDILVEIERDFLGALPVVAVVAVFSGMVLALQTGRELSRYGQEASIGALVSVSMCREMGPVMTAYILAGLIGSTIAAHLGTMKVSEEIDALLVMSIDPIQYLVLPRVITMAIITPLLTIYTNIIGVLGGAVVGNLDLDINLNLFFRNALEVLTLTDVYSGLFKSLIFGITIAVVGCTQGLNAQNGAAGVGQSTMKSVVIAFVTILIFNFFLTWLFY